MHTGISWWKICERVQWKRVHIYEQLYLHDVSTFVYFRSCPASNGFEKLSAKHVYLNFFLTDVAISSISVSYIIRLNRIIFKCGRILAILKNVERRIEREYNIIYCKFFISSFGKYFNLNFIQNLLYNKNIIKFFYTENKLHRLLKYV